ncbi:MAG: hypothetical protein B1H03_04775 [Planctomycetales bacterium 4484_113]|nr:MAG: hypothetical protein B1H03_04775 [Planctomycetales bacterium 4484_113]
MFSCGGRRLTLPQASLSSDSHASHRASSYDPFAPVQPTVRPDEAAIAALPGVEDSGFKLVAVNEHYESAPELLARLQMEVDGEAVRVILTRTIHRDAYLYLFYPTAEMHLRSADKGAALGEDYLFLAVAKHRGVGCGASRYFRHQQGGGRGGDYFRGWHRVGLMAGDAPRRL